MLLQLCSSSHRTLRLHWSPIAVDDSSSTTHCCESNSTGDILRLSRAVAKWVRFWNRTINFGTFDGVSRVRAWTRVIFFIRDNGRCSRSNTNAQQVPSLYAHDTLGNGTGYLYRLTEFKCKGGQAAGERNRESGGDSDRRRRR